MALWRFAVVFWGLAMMAMAAEKPWVVLEGKEGPGKGKHVVLIARDDDYTAPRAGLSSPPSP